MADLQASDFRAFFEALHGKEPFPWQEALAAQVCAQGWDDVNVIDLPTASGKTACIDIALFALAVRGGKAPRRIFFIVDRRVVVNEAYLRMREVRDKLKKALRGDGAEVLRKLAEELYRLSGNGEEHKRDKDAGPLLVSEMRGGAFRDETWVRNPLQPTMIASTVDQVGSRLLFRGYGVNPNSWPMHAGLIANDALIFLDEAHCSRAFAQTLERVKRYRGGDWATEPIETPFHFVEMTATPTTESDHKPFRLSNNDRNVDALKKRLQAAKPTQLIKFEGRKEDIAKLAEALLNQSIDLVGKADAKRAVIFVNRVKTAKEVHKQLREHKKLNGAQLELVIGSMRPVDRDDLYDQKLRHLKSGVQRQQDDPLTFVVSTQCLEVGADLDFDVLVSECASIDALQQRFGRLDRLGEFGRAQGVIVIGSWQVDPKQLDPVYRDTLSKTWKWLNGIKVESGMVDMGIESRSGEPPTVQQQLTEADSALRLQAEDAPVLLPAHVDMLAQTSPVPEPSPLVELFLHGPKRVAPDVQVVWRSDLEGGTEDEESKIIALCPPSTREAMSVSISAFRKWFTGERDVHGKESDLEIAVEDEVIEPRQSQEIYALAWDGEKAERISDARKIKPGQTLILKKSMGGWNQLGYIPDSAPIDVGDRAAFETRNSVSLRLHPEVMKGWPRSPALQSLAEDLRQSDVELRDVKGRLEICREELKNELDGESDPRWKSWPYKIIGELDNLRRTESDIYPGNEDHPGKKDVYVIRARRGAGKKANGKRILLEDHLGDVEDAVKEMGSSLHEDIQEALRASARLHDYGKVDVRYQAWLRNGDLAAARYSPKPLAKSGNDLLIKQTSVGLPEHFRHELLSLLFAEKSLDSEAEMRDLILHLVATHHGRCRPFAPMILDTGAECVSLGELSVCKEEREKNAAHNLSGGVADRFWRLGERYGWWGLAYLEALLRLADWKASEYEAAEVSNDN